MQYDSGDGAAAASSASEQQEATHPLILSLLAGLSTCLGASVVFFAGKGSGSGEGEGGVGGGADASSSPKTTGSTSRKNSILGKGSSRDLLEDEDHQHLQQPPAPVAPRRRTTATAAPLGHGHMSFSLALAGSVMVTVSFYSLLPESFSSDDVAAEGGSSSEMISIRSVVFWERAAAFAAGCCLYWLLSKCAFPEPDAILGFDDGQGDGGNGEGEGDESGVPLISGNGGSGGSDRKGASSAGDDADIELAPAASSSSSLEEQHPVSATRIPTPEKSSPGSNRRAFRARSHLSSSMDGNSTDGNINYNNNGNGDTGDALDASARSDAPESTERMVPYASGKDKGRRNFSSSIYFSFWECCCCCSSSCCGAMASCRRRGFSFSGSDLATTEARRAWRVTMLLFVSLAVHNFPEGFAVAGKEGRCRCCDAALRLSLPSFDLLCYRNIPDWLDNIFF